MVKIAIRGNKENGAKIIKYLEKFGGINSYLYDGISTNLYYYIGDSFLISTCFWSENKGLKYLLEIPKQSNYELWD